MPQDTAEIRGALRGNGRSGRVLRPRCHDDCPAPLLERLINCVRVRPMLIEQNGRGNASAGEYKSTDPTERRIFNPHVVPYPDVVAEDALDAVQGTADDSGCTRRDSVRFELGGGKREERLTRRGVQHLAPLQRPQRGLQTRKERRIGISAGEINRSVGNCQRYWRGEGGARRNAGSAPAESADQPPRSKQPVGGGHGRGIDSEVAGEVSDRRQGVARLGSSRRQLRLDRCRDARGSASDDRRHLYYYNIIIVLILFGPSSPLSAIESSPRRPLERRQCPVP